MSWYLLTSMLTGKVFEIVFALETKLLSSDLKLLELVRKRDPIVCVCACACVCM